MVVVVMPAVLQLLYLPKGFGWLVQVSSYALMLLLLLFGISALYRWGPSRHDAKWRWITPGALLAVAGIAIISVAFSWYAANFSNYNATYGSLGALIGFLTWMWLSVTVIIVGAELNSELEHQTARDSTIGRPKPLGRRGAYMADHVAAVGSAATPDGKADENIASGKTAPHAAGDTAVALGLLALLVLAAEARGRAVRPARRL